MLHRLSLSFFLFTLALVRASILPESYHNSKNLRDARETQDSPLAALLEIRAPPVKPKKPNPKPAPAPGKTPNFPKLLVPYKDDATDICSFYIDCTDQDNYVADELATLREPRDHQTGDQFAQSEKPYALSKRRIIQARLPGKSLTLHALPYPESSLLYAGTRQNLPKEVYDFRDSKLGTTNIKMLTSLTRPTDEYATEHIIELQTIGMFMVYAVKEDKTLEAFFRNSYVKPVPGPLTVAKRPNQPTYKLGTNPARDSLMRLVFEAMGSTANPTDFVLCEAAINSYKMRLWSGQELMAPDKYDKALQNAMKGAVPSSDFLSALRTTFGVYGYMNSPGVVKKTKSINANIRLELSNAGALYNDPKLDLAPMWDKFIVQQFNDAEAWGKTWLKARFVNTKKEIEETMSKLRKLHNTLKKAESGKDATKHAATQKKTQDKLEAQLSKDKQLVTAAEKELDDLKKQRQKAAKGQKQAFKEKIDDAKDDLKIRKHDVGITQRQIHELYAHSVNAIMENLAKDSGRVSTLEKLMPGLKLTPP